MAGEAKKSNTTACAQCTGPMVSISLRVTSGMRTMYSCSTCDLRVWVAEGDTTALRSVLAELSETDVPRRNSRLLQE
ncbi:MAG: hypothetical protein HKN26_09205 [Acidimicrobiales bacterium]|nr:hypothetical protein [Acidimicrobiales bacterium]